MDRRMRLVKLRVRYRDMRATWALAGAALLALIPQSAVFACACNCGGGGPPPVLPEAPWQPLLLVVGAAVALIVMRAGRGGPRGPRGRFQRRRGSRTTAASRGGASANIAKLVCFVTIAAGGMGIGFTITTAASETSCSTPTPGPTSGTKGITVTVPDAGAASALGPAGPGVAAGTAGAIVLALSLAVRRRGQR